MLNLESYNSKLNRREKYSAIEVTYWEVDDLNGGDLYFLFWLEEVTTFSIKQENVVIPLNTMNEDDVKIDYTLIRPLFRIAPQIFPVRNKLIENQVAALPQTSFSLYSLWGEDDNITITEEEFISAGGSIYLKYNTTDSLWEVIIKPPEIKIGTNETFSLSLEGSVPALVIAGYGYKYRKKSFTAFTEHYGVVDNVLDIELNHVSGKAQALHATQRLLEKYNTVLPEFDFDYWTPRDGDPLQQPSAVINHNHIVPNSISVELVGESAYKSASGGIPFNPLDSLIPASSNEKSLQDISNDLITLNDLQYNLRSYIH